LTNAKDNFEIFTHNIVMLQADELLSTLLKKLQIYYVNNITSQNATSTSTWIALARHETADVDTTE